MTTCACMHADSHYYIGEGDMGDIPVGDVSIVSDSDSEYVTVGDYNVPSPIGGDPGYDYGDDDGGDGVYDPSEADVVDEDAHGPSSADMSQPLGAGAHPTGRLTSCQCCAAGTDLTEQFLIFGVM